jgi:polygalacturonase
MLVGTMKRRDVLKLSPLALASTVGCVARAEVPRLAEVKAWFDVRQFGATGDGKTVDTPAINKAIAAVSAAGGGTLVFPAGTYICFTIRLQSNVDLYLANGCVIEAAASPLPGESTGYDGGTYDAAGPAQAWEQYQDYGHNHWANSLFYGEWLHDVSIVGAGLIHGKGLSHGGVRGRVGRMRFIRRSRPVWGTKRLR